MGKVTGWVPVAAEVAARLHGLSASEHRQCLKDCAEEYGLRPNTMQRMVRTYHYAAARIRSEGMRISDINAAFTAVETLERLSRVSPEAAAQVGRAVLTGEHSYREILNIYRSTAKENGPNPAEFDWDEFSRILYRHLYGSAPGSFVFNPERTGYSDLAKRLKVDVEFNIEDYERAVFLSPTFPFSEGRGRPIEDHLARSFMSMAYYIETSFIYISSNEERDLSYFVNHCSKNFRKKILHQFSVYRYEFDTKTLTRASFVGDGVR